jgi:hypothetical protein
MRALPENLFFAKQMADPMLAPIQAALYLTQKSPRSCFREDSQQI